MNAGKKVHHGGDWTTAASSRLSLFTEEAANIPADVVVSCSFVFWNRSRRVLGRIMFSNRLLQHHSESEVFPVMSSGKKRPSKSKRPYASPHLTKVTPAVAREMLEKRAVGGDVGAEEMLVGINRDDGLLNNRQAEIQKELEKLYQQLEEFSDPTPADAPAEYEVEELEAWEKLREQIRILEKELADSRRP